MERDGGAVSVIGFCTLKLDSGGRCCFNTRGLVKKKQQTKVYLYRFYCKSSWYCPQNHAFGLNFHAYLSLEHSRQYKPSLDANKVTLFAPMVSLGTNFWFFRVFQEMPKHVDNCIVWNAASIAFDYYDLVFHNATHIPYLHPYNGMLVSLQCELSILWILKILVVQSVGPFLIIDLKVSQTNKHEAFWCCNKNSKCT